MGGTRTARRAAAAAVLALLGASGCGMVFYRGPRGMEGALERQLHCELDRQFGLKLGFATSSLASGIVRKVAEEDDEAFLRELHLRHVGVAVFQVEDRRGEERPLDVKKLGLSGWDTLVRVKDDGEQVLVMTRPRRGGGIREAVLVSYDGNEVVLVRLKGELDRLIRAVAEAAAKERGEDS